ncbi:Large structural phosphoprotein [Labeo rohita]|uniref:Large structural phosphoprotein n=1 Tax=Labeo rohita TaxID=84645 RepID=A0ABQ8M6P2_LABRO|nr:Large structural phosphoprotein [Labeo rohita]
METPCSGGSAHLESIRGSPGGPVRFLRVLPLLAFLFPDRGPSGTDVLAHSWPWGYASTPFPQVSLLAQTLRKIREDKEQVLLVAPFWLTQTWFVVLAHPDLVCQPHASRDSPSLEDSTEEGL